MAAVQIHIIYTLGLDKRGTFKQCLAALVQNRKQILHRIGILFLGQFFQIFLGRPAANAANRRDHLELCGAFINRRDTGITGQPLTGIIPHITAAAQYLDRIIRYTIAHLRAIAFTHRGQHRGQTFDFLQLLLGLFGRILILLGIRAFGNLAKPQFQIHNTAGLIQQCPSRFDIHLHLNHHIPHRRQFLNRHTKLLSAMSIITGNTKCRFGNTHRLTRDTNTGAVHQAHHVCHKPALTFTDNLTWCIIEEQLACR